MPVLIFMLMMIMINLNSPISSILILVLITISISFMIYNISYSLWLPMIIFLMMVGGMLILFIYMASISPNKKSLLMPKFMLWSLFFCFVMNEFFPQNMSFQINNLSISIFSMMNNPPFMIFSISYLFFFLLMLTLIFKKKSGPLRTS